MSLRFKVTVLILLSTFALQANDKQTYTKAMELTLREVATIPAIMKDYVMVEMKNHFSNPEADLRREIESFQTYQKKLSALPLDEETKKAIALHQEMWKKLETELNKPVTKEEFAVLKKYTVPLRLSIKKMIRSIKAKLHDSRGDALYYTGKLSAVSQKFASLYMLLKWGMDNHKLHEDMEKQKEMYANALMELKKMPFTNKETKKVLAHLETDLHYFEFLETSTKTFMPALVYKKTNSMFEHTNAMMTALLRQ